MSISTEQLNTLILCGGAGARMGGQDKPLLAWHGRPMVEHVSESLPAQARRLISANRNLDRYAKYGTVITDQSTGVKQKSPLVGILAGLQHADRDWVLVTPGDTPCLGNGWYQPLLEAASAQSSYAYVIHDGKRQQHLHHLVHVDVTARLARDIKAGKLKVYEWLQAISALPVEVNEADRFRNVNQPDELDYPR